MKRLILSAAIATAGLAVVPSPANASTLTCTGADRELTVFNVMAGCHFGNGANPDATTVASALGGSWTLEGVLVKETGDGTNDLLTVTVDNDVWDAEANGTFSINPSFWSTYGRGAISIHVGQGNGDPDWWVFELVTGFTSLGTFDLNLFDGGGGGLSNIRLWGTGQPTQNLCDTTAPCEQVVTPEPGSLVLLGTGLLGFATVLRRRTRRA